MQMQFSYNQLRVLHFLKKHNGKIIRKVPTIRSITLYIANALDLDRMQVQRLLKALEDKNVVLRTHVRPDRGWAQGRNTLLRVELVDPKMVLPPLGKPLSVEYVLAAENRELDELTAHEPTTEQIVMALVDRAAELQGQIDRLQEVIEKLNEENERLRKQVAQTNARRERPEHLTQSVRSVLTAEQWDNLRHGTQD